LHAKHAADRLIIQDNIKCALKTDGWPNYFFTRDQRPK